MERKDKIKSLLTFYKCKLENKYYSDDAERIFLEEKIKHFEKILGDEWMCKLCKEGKEKLLKYDYANSDFEVSLDQENVLSIAYGDNESGYMDYVQIHIKYCPECGRKLSVI